MSERDKRAEGYNLKEDTGLLKDPSTVNTLRVSWKCYNICLNNGEKINHKIG